MNNISIEAGRRILPPTLKGNKAQFAPFKSHCTIAILSKATVLSDSDLLRCLWFQLCFATDCGCPGRAVCRHSTLLGPVYRPIPMRKGSTFGSSRSACFACVLSRWCFLERKPSYQVGSWQQSEEVFVKFTRSYNGSLIECRHELGSRLLVKSFGRAHVDLWLATFLI